MMNEKQRAELTEAFKTECHNKSLELDPDEELCWLSLSAGWAIGKGLTPEEALNFSTYIRYQTELG